MKSDMTTRDFATLIISLAAKKGLTEEQFTSAIDTARKIIRRNPVSEKCLGGITLEADELFGDIVIKEE